MAGKFFTAASREKRMRRVLGIRGQLMIFLCGICLLLTCLFWFLCAQLLEPMYNRSINRKLTAEADQIVGVMDEALANGTVLSTREMGLLLVNSEFKSRLYRELDESSNLTNFCVDIADSTGSIFCAENLYPCLLHNSSLSGIESADPFFRASSATVLNLRSQCLEQGEVYQVLEVSGGSSQIVVGRATRDRTYSVLVVTSRGHVAEATDILKTLLPFITMAVFVLAMVAAWLFSQWFSLPLRRLSAAAREIGSGNYDIELDTGRKDELGTLSAEFNQMAREVKRSAELQRELLANVSHDLRTPLTLMKGYAETVRDLTGEDKRKRDEQLNIIIDETDRLTGLVNSVMELSKVSSGAQKCEPVRFDMVQLCEEVSERYEAICEQNNWRLVVDVPQDIPLEVEADPEMMERVLHNLLGNAMHHIGADGIFILRAKQTSAGVRVEVEDHGEGIEEKDLPYIFDRYYRSRSDSGKVGTGLGLSITKAILQQHTFPFGVDSTVGRGTVFWLVMSPTPKKVAGKKARRGKKI